MFLIFSAFLILCDDIRSLAILLLAIRATNKYHFHSSEPADPVSLLYINNYIIGLDQSLENLRHCDCEYLLHICVGDNLHQQSNSARESNRDPNPRDRLLDMH